MALLDRAFDAVLATIRWIFGQLTYKPNQRLSAVFGLYIVNILLFAWFYHRIYVANLGHDVPPFLLNVDIIRYRNLELHSSVEQQVQPLRDTLAFFNTAETQLNNLKTVAPKQYAGSYYDSVEFVPGSYLCEIDLGPKLVDPYTNHLTKVMYLIVYENQFRRIYGNEFRFPGPLNTEPPAREMAEWEQRMASGADPALYKEVIDLAIQDVSARVAPLEFVSRATNLSEEKTNDKLGIWDYVDFVYFSTMTQTTVGYGDIVPNTTFTRLLAAVQVLMGLALAGFGLTFVIRRQSAAD
jgi:ABC-type Fe3+-siderophore transport system permease subunit